ncbi:MAG: hypothetical protein ACLFNQ_11955, partial [Spirochaetaceae bacterium]
LNGESHAEFPVGTRLVCDRSGHVTAITGLVPGNVSAQLTLHAHPQKAGGSVSIPFEVSANETLELDGRNLRSIKARPYITPRF